MKQLSAALLVISALGAVSGYLRELSMAITFGAGRFTDAYFIAVSIPMVVGDLLIGSVLTAVVVPVFTEYSTPSLVNQTAAGELFSNFVLVTAALGGLVALLIYLVMPSAIEVIAPGLSAGAKDLAVYYGHWLIWLLPINGLLLLTSLTLNASGAFIVPASNWPLANVIFFLMIFFGHFSLHADALIWAALLGPLAMLALNLWVLSSRDNFRWNRPRLSSWAFVQALRLARPVAATLGIGSGMGLLMASHLLVRQYGSWFGEGAVSALSYAFRLYEVPITLVTATAGTLVLPVFAKLYHENQIQKIASLSREMLGWGLIILLPIAAFVAIDAQWIVSILFHWGSFTQESATLTAEALRSFAPAILLEAVFMVFFRAIYSIHRPGVSVMVGLATLATLYVLLRFISGLNVFSWMALCLTGSFAIAAILCVTAVGRLLRQPIFPAKRDAWFAVLAAAGAGTALYVWEHHGASASMMTSLIGVAGFAAIYVAIVRFFLPQRWKQLLELVHKVPRQRHPAI